MGWPEIPEERLMMLITHHYVASPHLVAVSIVMHKKSQVVFHVWLDGQIYQAVCPWHAGMQRMTGDIAFQSLTVIDSFPVLT